MANMRYINGRIVGKGQSVLTDDSFINQDFLGKDCVNERYQRMMLGFNLTKIDGELSARVLDLIGGAGKFSFDYGDDRVSFSRVPVINSKNRNSSKPQSYETVLEIDSQNGDTRKITNVTGGTEEPSLVFNWSHNGKTSSLEAVSGIYGKDFMVRSYGEEDFGINPESLNANNDDAFSRSLDESSSGKKDSTPIIRDMDDVLGRE